MSHADVRIWYTTELFDESAVNAAEDALNDCFSQISRSSFYAIQRNGSLSGNWSNCDTYDEYKNEFESLISKTSGDAHALIYDRNLVQGWSFTDSAAAGKAYGALTSSNVPVFVANADLWNYDVTTYKNIVKQEFLHLIADGSNAPVYGNEHSFGTQYHEGGDLYATESSPMLTGYTEDKRGGNEKPSACCHQDSVNNADAHSGDMSSCIVNEAQRWTDNEY